MTERTTCAVTRVLNDSDDARLAFETIAVDYLRSQVHSDPEVEQSRLAAVEHAHAKCQVALALIIQRVRDLPRELYDRRIARAILARQLVSVRQMHGRVHGESVMLTREDMAQVGL